PPGLESVALFTFVSIEERALLRKLLPLAPGATLIDGLDDLEGQAHPRLLVEVSVISVFAGPDQLGLGDFDLRHGVSFLLRNCDETLPAAEATHVALLADRRFGRRNPDQKVLRLNAPHRLVEMVASLLDAPQVVGDNH